MSSRMRFRYWLLVTLCFLGVGCGYKLGVSKPAELEGIRSIHVAIPDNRTQYPRLEADLANHLADALAKSGQYSLSTRQGADAKLVTKIKEVNYRALRRERGELLMMITVEWRLLSQQGDEVLVLKSGKQEADTRFYFDENLSKARSNAFPDVLQSVSRQIVSSFSYSL